MLRRPRDARVIWQRFVELPGAAVNGVVGIASEHAIAGLIGAMRKERPRAILELGAGIGTLTYTVLKAAADLGIDREAGFRFVTIENETFCRRALEGNLADYQGRFQLLDSTKLIPSGDSFDLIIVDGGGDLPNDMGVMEFGGLLNAGGSILIEGSRGFQRDRIERWYGHRQYVYLRSSPRRSWSISDDGSRSAKNKPYHLYRFEPSPFRRLGLRSGSRLATLRARCHRGVAATRRVAERAAAALALLACLPILLMLAFLILLTSPGPVLFRQERVGQGGRRFILLKLRTMVADAGSRGAHVTARTDPRITSVGRFLRRFKLDEVPQLWNVVRGELSWVGPRPEVPCYVESENPRWQEVLRVRPGLTDPVTLALRDEEALLAAAPGDPEHFYRDRLLPYKLEGYCSYLRRRTPASDLGVLLRTLLAVLSPATARSPSLDHILRQRH